MKKILIVIMQLKMGGAEKSLVNFLNELPPQCADVDLMLIKKRGVLLKQIPDWVNIIDTPYELACLFGGPVKNVKGFALALLRICGTIYTRSFKEKNQRCYYRWRNLYTKAIPCLENRYDIAVSYLSGESMYYVAEKVSAERKVCWIHTDLIASNASKEEYQDYFQFFDKIVTISNECVKSICTLCSEVADKVQYLPNIVSSRFIRLRAEEENVLKANKEVFCLVSVGRLEMVKGFDMAIKAAAILKAQQVKFCWYIIGDGSEREHLGDLITKFGLENHVILMGMKENPYPYMHSCDLMVQTSRYEGKSIALDEAKILGIPVLATNYATVKDQIAPGEGWIVGMSPEEIAEGIRNVIENQAQYQNVKGHLQEQEYGNVDIVKAYMKCLGM